VTNFFCDAVTQSSIVPYRPLASPVPLAAIALTLYYFDLEALE
jgi:hypothetical protein